MHVSCFIRLIKRTDRSGRKRNGVYYSSPCPIILLLKGRGRKGSLQRESLRRHIKIRAASSLVRGFRFISVDVRRRNSRKIRCGAQRRPDDKASLNNFLFAKWRERVDDFVAPPIFFLFSLQGEEKKEERGGQRVIWVSMFDQFLNEVITRGRTDPLLPFPFPWLLFEGWFAREERKKKEKEQEEEKEVKADYKAVLNWYSDLFLFAGEKLRRRINSNLWPLPRPVRIIKVLLRANSNPATHPFLFLSPLSFLFFSPLSLSLGIRTLPLHARVHMLISL